jgi:hypothetical protein
MTRPPDDFSSLMGRVYLASSGKHSWIGGYRTGSVATTGWLWVDGTSVTNLNCGSTGCGPWLPGEPNNGGGIENYAHIWSAPGPPVQGLNDWPNSTLTPYTCEIEVCGPGQYLGPNFTAGCLQCPAGLYSVGGAVGGCTQCPPGTFGSSPGLSIPGCSGNCSTGYACPAGSTNGSNTPFSSPGSGSCFAACPDATWTPWVDTAGVEGAHSCFKRFSGGLSWTAASAACVALGGGSHLLTSRQVR